jgi:nucleotide-binding universal stress UspA family protein
MDSTLRSILLATDGTPSCGGARAAAAHLCTTTGAALHLVHAIPPWQQAPGEMARCRQMLQDEAAFIEYHHGCTVAAVHLVRGVRVPAIMRVARTTSADAIVVGSRGLGFVQRLLNYSVSRGIVGAAHAPVLVVPPDEGVWPPQHVLVGCDGTEESRHAARLGARIAKASEADLLIVGVAGAGALDGTRRASQVARECAASIDSVGVRRVRHDIVISTDAADTLRRLCQVTSGRLLLAVGARGSGALRRANHESVSAALVDSVHVPMLLVPPAVLARTRPRSAPASVAAR